MKNQAKLKKLEALLDKYHQANIKKKSPDLTKKIALLEQVVKKLSGSSDTCPLPKKKKVSNPVSEPVSSLEHGVSTADLPGTSILIEKGLFSELPLSKPIFDAIQDMKFTNLTEIQRKSIPYLLEKKDLMASAKTGSGKTLAFLIPVVEGLLTHPPISGTGAIIISPTRELSMQTYGVLKELTAHTSLRIGLVMGGTNRREEVTQLSKGVSVLVTTPGRLLDHLQRTEEFEVQHMSHLVIDEADKMLDIGFEEDMKQILRLLPKKRQTMFFSATLNEKTRRLASAALKTDCLRVGVDDQDDEATVSGLEQGYLVCPPSKRFCLLYTFLKKNKNKKIMVFMSACMEVKFYYELLNYIDIPVLAIHGKQKQSKRTETFFSFCQAETAVLLCTDVAARGLDIPQVDWIFQYDPPDDPKEYIHRVGRTARAGASGNALLLLRPHELPFLTVLRNAKVKVTEFEVGLGKLADIQNSLEKLVAQNYFLNKSAQEAYKGLVRSYASSSLKCFSVGDLDLSATARTFGLPVPPLVDLNVHSRGDEGGSKGRGAAKMRAAGGLSKKSILKTKIYRKMK